MTANLTPEQRIVMPFVEAGRITTDRRGKWLLDGEELNHFAAVLEELWFEDIIERPPHYAIVRRSKK